MMGSIPMSKQSAPISRRFTPADSSFERSERIGLASEMFSGCLHRSASAGSVLKAIVVGAPYLGLASVTPE
jgi:hypothetical protein